MKIKNTTIAAVIVIAGATACALTAYYVSVNLPAVSYEREKEQPAKAVESIANIPAPKVEEKLEDKIQYQPVSKESQGIEIEYPEESISDVSYDDALRDIKPEDEDVGVEGREAEIITEEGPPSQKIVSPLPAFEPIVSDTGPVALNKDTTPTATTGSPKLPKKLPETTEEHNYDGPPMPAGKEILPLPPFTPITNKTGPVAIESDR